MLLAVGKVASHTARQRLPGVCRGGRNESYDLWLSFSDDLTF